jgi:hypothetical protein
MNQLGALGLVEPRESGFGTMWVATR